MAVLIDVINDLEFKGGDRLLPQALVMARHLAEHSAFFSTTLDLLLRYLKTRTLVLGGLTGDGCVLFTASDAYLRDFELVVPSDGVASIDRGANRRALAQMRTLLHADVRPSRAVTLGRRLRPRGRAGAA